MHPKRSTEPLPEPAAELAVVTVLEVTSLEVTQATVDAVYALAMGLYTYVNPVPPVTGAPNLVKLLTEDCRDITGGVLDVETDAVKAVDRILSHIEDRRSKLGL